MQTSTQDAAAVAGALTAAWNSADGMAFAQQFTEDADFVNIFAMHVVGRSEVARLHQMIFDTIYRGSRSTFTVEKVRPLGSDAMVVLIKAQLDVPEGPMDGVVRTLITGVLVRAHDGWKIAAFQNTREQAPPEIIQPK